MLCRTIRINSINIINGNKTKNHDIASKPVEHNKFNNQVHIAMKKTFTITEPAL